MRKKMWEQLGQLEDRASPVLDQIRRDEQANSKGSPEKLATRAGRSLKGGSCVAELAGELDLFLQVCVNFIYYTRSFSMMNVHLYHIDAFNKCLFISDFRDSGHKS